MRAKTPAPPGAAAASPKSLCYVNDAQVNTLTLEHVQTIDKLDVKINAARGGTLAENSYEHLVQADFVSAHQATGKRVYFTILLGTQGALRGAVADSISAELVVSGGVEFVDADSGAVVVVVVAATTAEPTIA